MSLGLKLYYLRTRVKKVTQTVMAKDLKIRQATISNIEQGLSQPSLPLLRAFCRYFDVTPTYLLDEDGSLVTGPAVRWSGRHGLVGAGQYVEVPKKALLELPESASCLVALLPGTPVYDEEAARARARGSRTDLTDAYKLEVARRRSETEELRRELESERRASRMRRRGHSKATNAESETASSK